MAAHSQPLNVAQIARKTYTGHMYAAVFISGAVQPDPPQFAHSGSPTVAPVGGHNTRTANEKPQQHTCVHRCPSAPFSQPRSAQTCFIPTSKIRVIVSTRLLESVALIYIPLEAAQGIP